MENRGKKWNNIEKYKLVFTRHFLLERKRSLYVPYGFPYWILHNMNVQDWIFSLIKVLEIFWVDAFDHGSVGILGTTINLLPVLEYSLALHLTLTVPYLLSWTSRTYKCKVCPRSRMGGSREYINSVRKDHGNEILGKSINTGNPPFINHYKID